MNNVQSSSPAAVAEPLLTFPLSSGQQRLWFMDKLEPGMSVYNVPEALRLKGRLNQDELERSVNEIVRRHESLRTTFGEVDGEPVQIVAASLSLRVAIEDLTHLAPAEREREAARLASDDANLPFDLEHGPLLRLLLLRLGAEEHVLLVNMHHIVSEGGWSMGVFLRELNVLYNCFAAGQPSPLRDLEIQYGDYAVWEREWLQGSVRDELLSYWKTTLEGAPGLLELPTDHPRPATQTYKGSRESLLLPASLKAALQQLSNREGVTLFMTLLAAFKVLLFRYTRQVDVVVGVPVAGRNSPETHELIGLFVKMLALRTDLAGDPTCRELLERVRGVCSGAYGHDEIPLDVLVETLKPERSLSHTPLFQVMFAYQNAPREPLDLTGLAASAFEIEIRTSMFDLRLFLWEHPDGLLTALEYSTDLFDPSTARRLLSHFQSLLEGMVADPDRRISRLPLLSQQERHAVLHGCNETRADFPADVCLHTLFEQQARSTPEATAVVFENRQLTYRELNRRANQVARHLRKLGVRAETMVGVCLDRSPETIVGLLGILKAGGAYLPLDPGYPAERLKYILEDSQLALVLTNARLRDRLPVDGIEAVCLDQAWPEDAPTSNLEIGCVADQAAYVIYTSGSTGLPKGIVATHRSTLNRLAWMWERYPFQEDDICCSKTSLNFIDSVSEIFGPLLRGVRVVALPEEDVKDVGKLAATLQRHRITRIVVVPSLLRELLRMMAPGHAKCSSLRVAITSGEELPRDLAEQFTRSMPDTVLLNLYGSSEVAGDVTWFEVVPGSLTGDRVPIGRPIANTQVYIVDGELSPVPIGVAGELLVGGLNLARGYWNRPDLTAEKFIPDPYGPSGGRLYRTGDLARWLPDGNIEFLGRMDHQVKIRGYRIELGEIEWALAQHPGLARAVVGVKEHTTGDKRLIAYVVKKGGSNITGGELRGYLDDRLPNYMVPSAFVMLDRFPLTPNGKIDRRALLNLECEETSDSVTPADEVEARLSDIWCYVLGLNSISVNDNYFDLGGHSLLAVRLFSEINLAFHTQLPLGTLFHAPTVRKMSEIIRDSGVHSVRSAIVPVQREGTRPPIFCIGPLNGEVLLFRNLSSELGPRQPLYGLQPFGLGDRASVLFDVKSIAAYYIEQIRASKQDPSYCLLGYSFGGLVAIEIAAQLRESGEGVPAVILIDSMYPAACRAAEKLKDRFRRYQYHLREVLLGPDGLGHLGGRLKKRYVDALYNTASVLGAPLPNIINSIADRQLLASDNYRARPYAGRVVLFKAESRRQFFDGGPELGWSGILSDLTIHEVPGDHGTINTGTNLKILAELLRTCLEERAETIPRPLARVLST